MGALTASIKKHNPAMYMRIVDITGSSSYSTGGETFTNALFEVLSQVDAIVDCGTPGYVLVADIPNKKVKYFKGAAGLLVEETAAVNLSAVTGRIIVFADNPYI